MPEDTAVPLPEPVDGDAVQDGQILRPVQLRRAEALKIARDVMANKPGLFGGSNVGVDRTVYDLTYLADWIIDGPNLDPDPEHEETLSVPAEEDWFQPLPAGWEHVTTSRPSALDDADADADADLRTARSDADDGI